MCWPWNRYHHYVLFSLLYKGQMFWPLQLHLITVSICFLSLSWCLSVSLSVISSFSPRPVSPHMCIWQCALSVYLFISLCHISFCLSVPDSFCVLVTIQYSDVCTAVLDRALEKHVFSLQTPCWQCDSPRLFAFYGIWNFYSHGAFDKCSQ